VFSIPNVPLVELSAMLAQQLAVLFLKCATTMVLFLRLDVTHHRIELAQAHRKRAIATLPEKLAMPSIKRF
jgi:hypothetical protein